MLQHNLNYLSEVGVGVNLAFGMFSGMRDTLSNYLNVLINKKFNKIQACLFEVSNAVKSDVAAKVESIKTQHEKTGKIINNIMVGLAIICIIVFFYILVDTALNPDREINDIRALLSLGLVIGPFMLCAIIHLVSCHISYKNLNEILLPYIGFAAISAELKAKIDPAIPTD